MAIYSVHEPPAKWRETRRGPERFLFVRDGFHVWAFLLAPAWMLYRRLFLVFIGYLVIAAALVAGLLLVRASPDAVFWALVLLSWLVGLEAATLRRWTMRRRGWRELGIVSARNREEAVRRFFDNWDEAGAAVASALPQSPPAPLPMMRRPASSPEVLGLFPEPGAPR